MLIVQQIKFHYALFLPMASGPVPGGFVCVYVCVVCVVCTRVYVCYEYEDVNRPLDIPHE